MGQASTVDNFGMVGQSPAFRQIMGFVRRYATCDAPVLISGETGTGKELVARALHYQSDRRKRSFVPVNCGALPSSLVENELFGHSRGAYTDASAARRGLIAQAEGGTLLLDEIDALPLAAQVALLRFLQDRQYRPVGSDQTFDADVRVMAATNADLTQLVGDGRFRCDLLFRLDVGSVRVPRLRDRREDILPLADHFLRRFARQYGRPVPRLSAKVERSLFTYPWPGNVRELENAMHRAVILAETEAVTCLPLGVLATAANGESDRPNAVAGTGAADDYAGGLKAARARCMDEFHRRYLDWLLRHSNGNISEAARHSGTERRHLGRMIRRLGLSAEAYRNPAVAFTRR